MLAKEAPHTARPKKPFPWPGLVMSLVLGLTAGFFYYFLDQRHPVARSYHPAISKSWSVPGPLISTPAIFGNGKSAQTIWVSQFGSLTAISHDGSATRNESLGTSFSARGPLGAIRNKMGGQVFWSLPDGGLCLWQGNKAIPLSNSPALGAILAAPNPFALGPTPWVLLADTKGGAAAVSLSGGGALWWREKLVDGGDGFFSTPCVYGGMAIFASEKGAALALELSSGRTLWKTNFPTGFKASPTPGGGTVLFADVKGTLTLIEPHSGHVQKSLMVEAGSVASPMYIPRRHLWVAATRSGALLLIQGDLTQLLSRQCPVPGDGFRSSPVLIDGDQSGCMEVAAISGQGRLGLYSSIDLQPRAEPLFFGGEVTATPLGGDFDGDGNADLWVTLESGTLLLVGLFPGGARPGKPYAVQWGHFTGRN